MATTEEVRNDQTPKEEQEDDSSRKMLVVLLWILGIAAVALLLLLLWLLWPHPSETPQTAGYPIQVVTTIYGYGDGADEQLRTPLGVAFDDEGHVWISNSGQSRVEEYTVGGDFVRVVGADPNLGQLASPYGLDVDPNTDRVYIADFGAGFIQVYTAAGEYVTHFPADDQDLKVFGPDGFSPFDVQVVNGRVVAASNDGLYFFDTSGHVVGRWVGTYKGKNLRGPQFGQFNFPDSFAVDPRTGNYYVTDTANKRVVAISPEGRWLWVSGSPDVGSESTGFWQLPRSVQVGPNGNLYVIDTFRANENGMGVGHFVVLTSEGQLIAEFGKAGSADGAFSFPDQLATDSKGLWAIADRENHRVVIFRLLTPYPAPTEIETKRYQGAISIPYRVWSTPKDDRLVSASPSP